MISERLKDIRKELKLNQKEFAEESNTSYGTLQTYEQGKVKIPHTFLEILVENFKVNTNWLLTGQGKMFVDENQIKNEENEPNNNSNESDNFTNHIINDFKMLDKKSQKAIHLEILTKLREEGKI